MKIHMILVLALLALCFKSGTSLPKSVGTKDWKQYLPAQKRALVEDGDQLSVQANNAEMFSATKKLPSKSGSKMPVNPMNPMNPFLSIQPFLPVKPTFIPPFVDPQIFINKKAQLLNNLFTTSGSVTSVPPKSNDWQPFGTPNFFTQKKTELLNTLFTNVASNSETPSGVQENKRDLSGSGPMLMKSIPTYELVSDVKTNEIANQKNTLLDQLLANLNLTDMYEIEEDVTVTPKATIVPPNYWMPFTSTINDTPQSIPLAKVSPTINPMYFIDKKTKFLNTLFNNLGLPQKPAGVPPTKAPIVPPNFWIPPGKPDVATMYKQKVSDFLDKLFNSLNSSVPPASVTARAMRSLDTNGEAKENSNIANQVSVKPRFIGGPMNAWAPPPVVDPKIFIDKKTEFLNKLFSSISVPSLTDNTEVTGDSPLTKPTIVPPSFWLPFASSIGNMPQYTIGEKPVASSPHLLSPFVSKIGGVVDYSTSMNPPFASGYNLGNDGPGNNAYKTSSFMPVTGGGPIIDPKYFIDKKSDFLNNLFNGISTKPVTSPFQTKSDLSSGFKTMQNTGDTTNMYDTKTMEFLRELFKDPNETYNIEKRSNDNGIKNSDIQQILPEEVLDISDDISKRTLSAADTTFSSQSDMTSNPLLVAKDKVVSSIITELGGIKNEMMDTLTEIMNEKKEAAVATTPPFGMNPVKSAFAFGGGKMGGPMYGAGKMGGGKMAGSMYGKKSSSSSSDIKKKTGPPFGGSFPFWGDTPITKPTPDPTLPLQKRLDFLNQVFEMLTKLQEDVTSAVNEAAMDSILPPSPTSTNNEAQFLDLLQQILKNKNNATKGIKNKSASQKSTRGIESESPPFPHNPYLLNSGSVKEKAEESEKTRSIKMAVHQGYQSLPPGTEELIQAGGGSDLDNQEGGGLKLQNGDNEEIQYDRSEHHQHHHHNHNH